MNLLTPMMVAALIVGGMGVALLGSLKVPLARRLQIDEARVGGLVSMFGFILIPVMLVAGFLTDGAGQGSGGIGKQTVLQVGSFAFALGLVLLASATRYATALTAVVVLSASWAIMINAGNVLVEPAFAGLLKEGEEARRQAFAQNLGNVFFGLGAFLTPLVIGLLLARVSLPAVVAVLAVVSVLPALLAFGVDVSGPAASSTTTDAIPLTKLLSQPLLWLCGLAMFFYGPLEASMAAWTTTYLMDHGVSEEGATRSLSAFWLAFLTARLVTALTLPGGWEALLVLALALTSAVLLSAMVLSRHSSQSIALVIGAGLVFGPIFPTLMAVLLGSMEEGIRGRAVGVFFAIGGVGWTLIPMFIGAQARSHGIRRGFAIVAATAGCLTIAAVILVLR
jgi:fucose permease